MSAKRNLKLIFQRMFLHLKGMGILFWIPLVAVHGLIPLISLMNYKKNGASPEFAGDIVSFSQLLIPMFSCWWTIFLLREYVECDGNELLYVCRTKVKFIDILCPFFLYFLTVILQFSVYISLVPMLKNELVRLLCLCVFYFGLAYFLMFLTKSTAVVVMSVLTYTVVNYIAKAVTMEATFFPLYFDPRATSRETYLFVCLPMAVCGIALLCGGVLLNKFGKKYN